MPIPVPETDRNRLLSGLPRRERQRLLACSRAVDLVPAEVLGGCGERMRHAYFPLDSCVSVSTHATGDAALDVGLIGREGMLGIGLVLGVEVSNRLAVVRGPGLALRIDARPFRDELLACPGLARTLRRYVQVRLIQLAQSAACSHFHVVEARLARLLLMTQDRARTSLLHLTHEALAGRLGVRRAGISHAAVSLQRLALIAYHRGEVTVLDRDGLQRAACSCYAADNDTYARIMGNGTGTAARRRRTPHAR